MDKEVTSLVPKVIEDGKEVIRPDILQVVTQLASVAQLARIRKTIEKQEAQMEKIPEGKMRPFEKTISGDTIEMWKVIDDVGQKCSSGTVYNDGPNSVWVCLNDIRDGFQEVKEGESLDFSFKHPVIERFFFKSTADGEASLRIPLEY